MKKLGLFFMILFPLTGSAQLMDDFSDGNFTANPAWAGTTSNFKINASNQLQSQATTSGVSWLFSPSAAIENAVWECWIKIAYSTSASNYAAFYPVSDSNDLSNGCNGYYVQVGGTNDEVSLYVQEGTKKTKIIDGADKRTDGNPVEIRIRLTRDAAGHFVLYSKKAGEADYITEGSVQNQAFNTSAYTGVLYANTSTTGSDYYFDDVSVTGEAHKDTEAPRLVACVLSANDHLQCRFSEAMDYTHGSFSLSDAGLAMQSVAYSTDGLQADLHYSADFAHGSLYTLCIAGLTDLAGNVLADTCVTVGYVERPDSADVVINEIMCENPEHSAEYVELYNLSHKVLDLSACQLSVQRADNSWSKIARLPAHSLVMPCGYLALTAYPDSVSAYHHCPDTARISPCAWTALNNEGATLGVLSVTGDTVYDKVSYSAQWHHVLIKNPKGVALEKINPAMPSDQASSWHSGASETNYGTPGYQNRQYRLLEARGTESNEWQVDPEAFTPDNDGIDDVCFIRYKTADTGYVANVRIFTADGHNVCKLALNQLLGTEGFIVWDGRTDAGKNVRTGVYVVYLELFNPSTGFKKCYKKPVVVTLR